MGSPSGGGPGVWLGRATVRTAADVPGTGPRTGDTRTIPGPRGRRARRLLPGPGGASPPPTATSAPTRDGPPGTPPGRGRSMALSSVTTTAVLVLVGTFFVAQAMFSDKGGTNTAKVTAPNLVGKSLADARTAATAAGSKLTVAEGDKIACPDTNVKKDQVCTQTPTAGTQVSEDARITVQLSSGPAKQQMPPLTGKTKDQAMQALASAGFTNVATPDYKDDDTAPQDTVVAQDPAAGATVDPSAPVKLTVSQGKTKVNVPSVVGSQKDDAQNQLQGLGFQVDASKTTQTNDPTKVNTVASQSVAPNSKVPANTKISLTIYKAPEKSTVPPLQNSKLSDAIAALSKAGLGYTVISGPQDLNAVVIQSNPGAGTQLDPNTQVQLFTRPADPAKGGDPLTTPPTKGGNDH